MNNHLVRIGGIFLALSIISLLIICYDADMTIARELVAPGNRWPGNSAPFWRILYQLAPIPGLLLAAGALLLLGLSQLSRRLMGYRSKAAFIVLLALLGPGLLVNVVCKDHLGRPRPRDLIDFGGEYHFVKPGHPGPAGRNSSFPSGHASIAFFLMAPWFIYRQENRRLARVALISGLAFGTLVGLGRMIQGAHFISDVLWAGGMVYLSGEFLSLAFGSIARKMAPRKTATPTDTTCSLPCN